MKFQAKLKISKQSQLVEISTNLCDLKKQFGYGRWRKLKGAAHIQIQNGNIRKAELHWYEAHGIGRKKISIKRFFK